MAEKTLEEAVNQACELLPEGFQLNIACENGSAWVELYSRTLDVWVGLPDAAGKPLTEQVEDGLITALAANSNR